MLPRGGASAKGALQFQPGAPPWVCIRKISQSPARAAQNFHPWFALRWGAIFSQTLSVLICPAGQYFISMNIDGFGNPWGKK
jgi:hypothetical protein